LEKEKENEIKQQNEFSEKIATIQKEDAKKAKIEADKAKETEKKLLTTEFNKQKSLLEKKLNSEKQHALSSEKVEVSNTVNQLEEQLSGAQNEVKDKIKALQWADADKKAT